MYVNCVASVVSGAGCDWGDAARSEITVKSIAGLTTGGTAGRAGKKSSVSSRREVDSLHMRVGGYGVGGAELCPVTGVQHATCGGLRAHARTAAQIPAPPPIHPVPRVKWDGRACGSRQPAQAPLLLLSSRLSAGT